MKQDTAVYYATGDIEDLSKKLRDEGFGVPCCWEDIVNDSVITRRISPNLETISSKIKGDGTIVDSVIVGDIEIERGNKGQKITEFKLEVYLSQSRGDELEKFADNYEPSTEI